APVDPPQGRPQTLRRGPAAAPGGRGRGGRDPRLSRTIRHRSGRPEVAVPAASQRGPRHDRRGQERHRRQGPHAVTAAHVTPLIVSGPEALAEFRRGLTGERAFELLAGAGGRLLVTLPVGVGKTEFLINTVVHAAAATNSY